MQVLSKLRVKSYRDLHPLKVFDEKIKKYIEYYGGDIEEVYKNYNQTLKFFLPLVALVTFFGVLKFKLFLFSVPALALIAYFYPLLYVWAKAEEHKKIVNNETPFIALIAYIDSLIDKGFNYTLKELSQIKELKTPKVEQNFIEKMTNYMNMSFARALERRSLVHSGDLLGKLYDAYLSALELGITIRDRLHDVSKDLLNELKDNHKLYVDKSSGMAEMVFSVFLLMPIVLIGFSFTFKVTLTELLFPLIFTPGLYFLASSQQPSFDYDVKLGKYAYILVAIPIILMLPGISLTYKTIAIVIIITVLSYFVYSQFTLARELEKTLPFLLKELSQYMKIGYTVQNAIQRIKIPSKRARKAIREYLKDPENVNSPSKLFNLTFKLLFIIAKTGATSSALEELGAAVNEIVYAKDYLVKQLRMFDAFVVLTPFMLWLTFTLLGKISTHPLPEVTVISAYSVASALTFSKISRFALLYFPTMLATTIALFMLLFLPAQHIPIF